MPITVASYSVCVKSCFAENARVQYTRKLGDTSKADYSYTLEYVAVNVRNMFSPLASLARHSYHSRNKNCVSLSYCHFHTSRVLTRSSCNSSSDDTAAASRCSSSHRATAMPATSLSTSALAWASTLFLSMMDLSSSSSGPFSIEFSSCNRPSRLSEA